MADLTSEFLGVTTPNPFWLASAPPTDKAYNVNRAFEAGWGGAIWKTLGEDPPIVDCIYGHDDLTVTAVQDGKVAANAIDHYLHLQE